MFDDMTADLEYNKILNPKVTELFLRGENLIFPFFYIAILFQSA